MGSADAGSDPWVLHASGEGELAPRADPVAAPVRGPSIGLGSSAKLERREPVRSEAPSDGPHLVGKKSPHRSRCAELDHRRSSSLGPLLVKQIVAGQWNRIDLASKLHLKYHHVQVPELHLAAQQI